MEFQIVKIDGFYKAVLTESCLCVTLKIPDVGIEPDRFSEIKLRADFIKCVKNFFGSRGGGIVTDDGILQQMIVFQ